MYIRGRPHCCVITRLRGNKRESSSSQFCRDFEIYFIMEEAYQSGKLQDRIAPCCYGAFEGNNIDVLMKCPYHRECFEPLGYLDAQRNVLRRSRCYVHWIFMIGGPILRWDSLQSPPHWVQWSFLYSIMRYGLDLKGSLSKPMQLE